MKGRSRGWRWLQCARQAVQFPVLLLLIVAGFYWKLTLTNQFDWAWSPDLANQILPWFDEEARQAQHHQFPLWDAHEWAGQSLIGQAQPGVAYPLNWLFWLMPRRNGHIQMAAVQWYYVLIHWMATLFAYYLCRDLGRSRIASVTGGLIFSLAGYMGTTEWPQMLNGAVWTPLVFLFLLRAARGRRPWSSAGFCGACLGMSWLSGHHQIPIFLTLPAAGCWIFFALPGGRIDRRIAAMAGLAIVIAGMVGALQILPAEEYGRLALRWVGAESPLGWGDKVPYSVHRDLSLRPGQLVGILVPGQANFPSDHFLGATVLTMALLGAALAWRERAVRVFAALGIAGFGYALGGNSVFQGLLYAALPYVEKARVPAAAVFLLGLLAAVLTAAAVDGVPRADNSFWVRRFALGVGLFGALAGFILYGVYVAQKLSWSVDDRILSQYWPHFCHADC